MSRLIKTEDLTNEQIQKIDELFAEYNKGAKGGKEIVESVLRKTKGTVFINL